MDGKWKQLTQTLKADHLLNGVLVHGLALNLTRTLKRSEKRFQYLDYFVLILFFVCIIILFFLD